VLDAIDQRRHFPEFECIVRRRSEQPSHISRGQSSDLAKARVRRLPESPASDRELSSSQTAQRLFHESRCQDTGRRHSPALVKQLLAAECADILARLGDLSEPELRARYQSSLGIALRWIRNYTELDFRSLGTYTRDQLTTIGREREAL